VLRILQGAEIKPHRLRPWLHSPDPNFREKVTRICDLYLNPPENAVVLCIDEKPVQALGRRFPTKAARKGQAGREDYEYVRHGTFKVLAAFDVATGTVYAECRPTRTAEDLIAFMENLAARTQDLDVYVIWDNLNIHCDGPDLRWTEFNRRHDGRFHFVYTPLHASWVNQVEIFFSILGKRVLRHASFENRDEAMHVVDRFIEHWNHQEAHPFLWTFKGYPLQTGMAA
jgi:transposase